MIYYLRCDLFPTRCCFEEIQKYQPPIRLFELSYRLIGIVKNMKVNCTLLGTSSRGARLVQHSDKRYREWNSTIARKIEVITLNLKAKFNTNKGCYSFLRLIVFNCQIVCFDTVLEISLVTLHFSKYKTHGFLLQISS